MKKYNRYEDYIEFQKTKTLDPARRKKWLNEEWDSKISGFEAEFRRHGSLLKSTDKVLCLGARTGQEVVALKNLGIKDVIGIDIVPHEPHVILGDMHNLQFGEATFDFVYSNVIDHSIDPAKMLSEIERVLKIGGRALIQIQLGINQDEYTEFKIENPVHDILPLLTRSYCTRIGFIWDPNTINFAGMNFEIVFEKDEKLDILHSKYSFDSLVIPDNYHDIWNLTNDDIQRKKAKDCGLSDEETEKNINSLKRRAFYLTRVADAYDTKIIAEVGSAQGCQFYSFCEFARESPGRHVYSCDTRDVRNQTCLKHFEEDVKIGTFVNGDSKSLSEICKNVKMFFINGDCDANAVTRDVVNLQNCQTLDDTPVWVFNNFDTRFESFKDICKVCFDSQRFRVIKVGKTLSGHDNHIAIVYDRI